MKMLERKVELPGALLKAGELLWGSLHRGVEALERQLVKRATRRPPARNPPGEPEGVLERLARELTTTPGMLRVCLLRELTEAEKAPPTGTEDLWGKLSEMLSLERESAKLTRDLQELMLESLKASPGEAARA